MNPYPYLHELRGLRRRATPARLRSIAALALCGLLSACGIARPPAGVDAGVPALWNAPRPADDAASPAGVPASSLPHDGSTAALSDWWRRIDDPVLATLVDAAQAASPTIASAAARIAEARTARTQAGAALLPTVDGTLSAQRSNSPFGGGSLAGGGGTSLPGVTTLQAGLQSQWEIDLFGGRRAGRDAAASRLRGAGARWHEARVSVAADTATLYVDERACRAQLAVAGSDARSRAETARLTDLSARAGFTAPASAADASARLTQQRVQCALLRKGLYALTGIEGRALDALLDGAAAASGTAALPAMPVLPAMPSFPALPVVDEVPARLLSRRPDVYAAEQAVAAASAEVGAAEADRYPRLTLQGSIAALQLRSGGLQQSLQTWTVGPVALSLPIFDGGVRAAAALGARARYDESASLYRASARQAVREVEEALVRLQGADARTGDADTAVRNYQASLDATEARFASGLGSLFELEDARRTLFVAQTARVALQRERAEAWVSLYRATGGGWTRPGDDQSSTQPQAARP